MEAVIKDGGRQYRVKVGELLDIDFREAEKGSALEFPEVLYVGGEGEPKIGKPALAGAKVLATVIGPVKGKKLAVALFRRRKGLHTRTGHRQPYLRVKIESIQG
jgi:large subunit ribosomal protein L21